LQSPINIIGGRQGNEDVAPTIFQVRQSVRSYSENSIVDLVKMNFLGENLKVFIDPYIPNQCGFKIKNFKKIEYTI